MRIIFKTAMEKQKSENGAIIIEASLSLTLFLFALITVYSMYHVSLAQARISSALNATAKEISQYSYAYGISGLKTKQANLSAYGGAAESIISDNFSEVENLYTAIEGLVDCAETIAISPDDAESFAYYVINQGIEQAKGWIVDKGARSLMKKHFGADPDGFLKGLGVEQGTKGLNFKESTIFKDGKNDLIVLNCRYKVRVIKLLGIDMEMNFELTARTRAWVGD